MSEPPPASPVPAPSGPAAASGAGGPAVSPSRDPLFWAMSSEEQLWLAWERTRANNGAAGSDGMTIARFDAFAKPAIARLSGALRSFRYRPGEARRVYVPKKSGGVRPLDIPNIVDRVAQGAASLTLMPVLEPEMEASSFAYRPGRGVMDAVRRVSALRRDGFVHVVDADISRFFESVPHEPLLARLERLTGGEAILDLIALWLEWYAPAGVGLPQGSPLSPLLANLYLDSADEAMEGRGVRLVRYADDFLLLARSADKAEAALKGAREVLAGLGLELNLDKTRLVSFDQGFRFLGHLFVRSLVAREIEPDAPPEDAISAAELANAIEEAPGAQHAAFAGPEPAGEGEHAPGFRTLYVLEPGRRLGVAGEAFAVFEGESKLLALPAGRVGRIELSGTVTVEMAALDLAAASDVEVARVNGFGETIGRWGPNLVNKGHARRHLAQAALALDPAARLTLARILVDGRVRNQRALLHRINRERKDAEVTAAAVQMNPILRRLRGPRSVEQAMGYEGQAAALFWPAMARAIDPGMGFTGKRGFIGRRSRRPGLTPFDQILNALSSMLARDVGVAALRHGLHPGIPIVHAPEDGEDALVYDLMEEFRAPLVEGTALALVNRGAVVPEGFRQMSTGAWAMSQETWKAIIRGYEAALARTIASPRRHGHKVTWRQAMADQAAAFALHCEGTAVYQPIVLDY